MQAVLKKDLTGLQDGMAILMGSLLIALFSQLAFRLPFSPVPFILTSHICLLLGIALGPKRGALAVCAYLAQGALGLPVFALGKSGLLHLMGPTGGYLIGMVLATYLTGYLAQRKRSSLNLFGSLTMGTLLILACGALYLSYWVGISHAFLLGFAPFLVTDLLKSLLVTRALQAVKS